jgi:hypothetical protein
MATDKKKNKNLDDILPAHWMNAFDDEAKSKVRLSPSERVKMIVKAFQDILCREPDTRDLNFYKYSSISEEEIRQELLKGKEHKTLLETGRNYKKLNNILEDTKSRIRLLEAQIKDQENSIKQMNLLLKEKNLHIEQLKKKDQNTFESI